MILYNMKRKTDFSISIKKLEDLEMSCLPHYTDVEFSILLRVST